MWVLGPTEAFVLRAAAAATNPGKGVGLRSAQVQHGRFAVDSGGSTLLPAR